MVVNSRVRLDRAPDPASSGGGCAGPARPSMELLTCVDGVPPEPGSPGYAKLARMGHEAASKQSGPVITELLSYRLHRVANAFERGAALLFRKEFDVSLGEWRALALIASGAATTTNRIARLAGIDPAQMSRIITKLAERGFLTRSSGPRNSAPLSLTPEGMRTYEGLIAAARARNDAFFAALTEDEIVHLDSALEKLAKVAISMERAVQAAVAEEASAEARPSGVPAPRTSRRRGNRAAS